MSLDQVVPLDTQFARSVTALAFATETWPALNYLSNAREPPHGHPGPPDPSKPQPADAAISALQSIANNIHAAGLISQNEELDEIPTRSLKYLLVPYLLAQALQSWQGAQQERLDKLQQSSQELQTFFQSMARLRLLSDAERDRVLDNTPEAVQTPAQKREEKIARYKLEKTAAKRLQHLMERLKTRAQGEDDEEGERDASLVVLQSAVRRALDLHEALAEELELLRYAERMRAKGVDPSEHARRARPRGPPPGMRGMPPSFRIVNEREREREAVFRPSHSLPTYTVEEWGRIEAERMAQAEREKREGEIAAKKRKDEEDSDGDEAVDRETMEARRWDDWKDEHNRGSGNTIR